MSEGIRTWPDGNGDYAASCPFGDYELTSYSQSSALQAVSFHMTQAHPGVEP